MANVCHLLLEKIEPSNCYKLIILLSCNIFPKQCNICNLNSLQFICKHIEVECPFSVL